MDQLPARDRVSDEIARIRAIVARHPLPALVTGFDVRLGEFDGDPALWVVFHSTDTVGAFDPKSDRTLLEAVRDDLLGEVAHRYPFFRFETDREGARADN